MKKSLNRRSFLATSAIAGAGLLVVPRHVLGGKGFVAPSDKLNIAAIGSGGMGAGNLARVESENIVALCDVDDVKAAATFNKYPNAPRFKDFRVMLDKIKGIDAVIVATPDHTHAVAAMAAIRMGKHVYVQKPLAHSVYETRMLTEAVRKYNVVSQMGNQGRSGEGTRRLAEWIWAGAIGDIREVHSWTNRPVWPQGIGRPEGTPPVPDTLDWNLWLGPATERPYHPDYLPFNWRAWYDFGCGALGDMGCHVLDPVFHAMKLKYPEWVQGSHSYEVREMWKRVDNQETYPNASMITYQFPERGTMPALRLTWYDGGLMPVWPKEVDSSKVSMEGGSMFIGDKGIIVCSTYGGEVMMFPEERFLEFNDLPASLPRIDGTHEQDWINGIKNHTKPCSDFDYSGPLTEMVLMGNLAIRVPGKRLMWDGDQMKVTNDEEANRFIHNDYRSGWVL